MALEFPKELKELQETNEIPAFQELTKAEGEVAALASEIIQTGGKSTPGLVGDETLAEDFRFQKSKELRVVKGQVLEICEQTADQKQRTNYFKDYMPKAA